MNEDTAGRQDRILAVHPTTSGFGWVLLEGLSAPIDWGVVTVHANKNARSLARIERLFERYEPECCVLEQFEGPPSRRSKRIRMLCRSVVMLAGTRNIGVRIYSRAEVSAVFEVVGAKSRREIAVAVASHIEAFKPLLPAERKIWLPENPHMGLFGAAALAMTHFAAMGGP